MSDSIMLKAVCDWQIFGDVDPIEHLHELFRPWMGRGADGADGDLDEYLNDFSVIFSDSSGPFGLSYILFTVDTPLQKDDLSKANEHIKKRLDRFVGDIDVNVRWVVRTDA